MAQQYKYEVGPSLGMTGYLGESNNGNLFKHPSVTVGGNFRYVHNSRWAFKANLNYANLRGDSMYDESWYPDGANYKFSSHLVDLGLTAEFNFLNFGRGPAYKKYKPIFNYLSKENVFYEELKAKLEPLAQDYSHITKKLFQTINYLTTSMYADADNYYNLDALEQDMETNGMSVRFKGCDFST